MKRFIKTLLHNLLLAFLAFVWLVPIVWLVVTSFSAYTGMNTSTFFPKEWSLAQYKNLLFSADSVAQFPNWFKNTFIIACVVCVISTAFVLMVAYATSCMRFPARKPLMNAAVIVNLFPGVLSMIAVYFILKTLNLTNTHLGLILVYSAGSGLGYLIDPDSPIMAPLYGFLRRTNTTIRQHTIWPFRRAERPFRLHSNSVRMNSPNTIPLKSWII